MKKKGMSSNLRDGTEVYFCFLIDFKSTGKTAVFDWVTWGTIEIYLLNFKVLKMSRKLRLFWQGLHAEHTHTHPFAHIHTHSCMFKESWKTFLCSDNVLTAAVCILILDGKESMLPLLDSHMQKLTGNVCVYCFPFTVFLLCLYLSVAILVM